MSIVSFPACRLNRLTPGHLETTLCGGLGDDVYLMYYTPPSSRITHAGEINVKTSGDRGRTWSVPRILLDKGGEPILGSHITLLRLKSGGLGLVYASDAAPLARTAAMGVPSSAPAVTKATAGQRL